MGFVGGAGIFGLYPDWSGINDFEAVRAESVGRPVITGFDMLSQNGSFKIEESVLIKPDYLVCSSCPRLICSAACLGNFAMSHFNTSS